MKLVRQVEGGPAVDHKKYQQVVAIWIKWPSKRVGYLLYKKTPKPKGGTK